MEKSPRKQLLEKLNEIDRKCLDEGWKFYDLRSLYESTEQNLTPDQKKELVDFVNKNPNVKPSDVTKLATGLQAVNDPDVKQKLNASAEDELDNEYIEDLDKYYVFIYGQNRDVKKPFAYGFATETEAEDFCNDHDWEYVDPETEFVWHMDYAPVAKKSSNKEIYGIDLTEKLVDAPQDVLDELLGILGKYGFILDDSIEYENPSRSLIFGDVHIQVINPDSYIDTSDEINVQEQLKDYIPQDLIDEIHELDQRSNCPITWNFGPNKDGQVTGGLDIMKQYIEESLDEASYGGAYDIEDDMFFTKEDLLDFTEEVIDRLEDEFNNKFKFYVYQAYFNSPTDVYVAIEDETDGLGYSYTFKVDMRKIKKPSDLLKYVPMTVKYFKDEHEKNIKDYKNSVYEELKKQTKLNESVETPYFKAYITNLGKYNEGALVGKWVEFPIDETEFDKVLESIGIGDSDDFGAPYEEWFVTDYDCNLPGFNWQELGEYPSYESLQEYGEKVDSIDDVEAVSNALEVTGDLDRAIDGLDDGSIIFFRGVDTYEDLAYRMIDEMWGGIENLERNTIEQYFDYEALGRDLNFDTYEDSDGNDVSAGEFFCGDEDAADQEIGEAFVEDVGFDGVGNIEGYFDYEAFGRDLSFDGFTLTSDGCILEESLKKRRTKRKLTEGWAHFYFKSGANPYIAKTEKEANRIIRKYGKKNIEKIKDGFFEIDDVKKECLKEGKYDSVIADLESIEKFLRDEGFTNYDVYGYDSYPMDTSKIDFEISGDWKHDHWAFKELIQEWAQKNGRHIFKHIFKIDTEEQPSDSDYYTAVHSVYITKDDDALNQLNSMRALFDDDFDSDFDDDFDESLKEDWIHFSFKSGSNPYIAKSKKDADRIIKKYGKKNVKEKKPGFYEVDDKNVTRGADLFNEDYFRNIEKEVRDFTHDYELDYGEFVPSKFNADYLNDLFDELKSKGYTYSSIVKDHSKPDTLDNYTYIFERENELDEDTEKNSKGKWVNKGKEGTHGEFRTKKAADAQRKAMFANGYTESFGYDIPDKKRLTNEDKRFYIDEISTAEDREDLEDIVHEIFFYDKGLFVMLRHFPKDMPFEELRDKLIEIIQSTILEESLYEDYERKDDEWGDPYSYDEVERELKKITNNWSDKDGTIRCYYEQEKQYGMQILKKHYDIVEPSDGRTGPGEEMSWVLAYARPKEQFDESFDDRVVKETKDYRIVKDNLNGKREVYSLWLQSANPREPRRWAPTTMYFDTVDEAEDYYNRKYLDESLTESRTSRLQDAIIDCLDWFIMMEMEFPKDKFLADSWEDVKDGIVMGIDPEFEVAEGIVEYFKPIVTFNDRYNKEVEEEGIFQDEIELYKKLVDEMNRYLKDNGYDNTISY